MLEKYQPADNLTAVKTNPAASAANIRQPKSARRPMPLSPPTAAGLASGGGSVFEAMMAVNQSQNKIFDQVLDGPVSQQTQRQLAQLQAQNMKNSLADEISEGREKPPAQRKAIAEAAGDMAAGTTNEASTADKVARVAPITKARRSMGLTAGPTIVRGIDTGRVFSPAQLTAFRQKVGLGPSATEQAAQSLVAGVSRKTAPATDTDPISKFIRGGQEQKRGNATTVSKSAILDPGAKDEPADLAAALAENPAKGANDGDIDGIIERVGEALGLDPSLIKAVIKTESNFNHQAVSSAGAKGLMQLMPGTAKEMGVKDPFNPLDNIWGGARYLKRMLDNYGGNLNKALAAYNWGPGNVNRHGAGGKNMPRETRRYIEVVNRNYNRFKKSTASA
ncbi:MAG: lytic transglycosylase domain-containing protein [Deltaproteobacteria bacterium]|jgi:soluble lytic murein transglycosylase-like protein|nr:lytic transglycosylase domain-containing protein [Deltaproteobacteria bacterium]